MKIFIQIASYRDPQLIPTIKDCIDKAKKPENLVFGICRQFHPEDGFDNLSEYENDKRFRILNIPYQESTGVCWARNQVQQLYKGEKYTLQLDSHMRFEQDWDDTLIKMIKQLQKKGYKKPLLTGYVSSFDPENDPQGRVTEPWRMVFDRFTPEGVVFFLPEVIPNWKDLKEPIPTRFYSAHFAFTLGEFSKEVQHDPEYYFHGEEISIAVRAYTGILFSKRSVQKYTLDKNYPPNPYDFNDEEEWLNSFTQVFKHCIDISYDYVKETDYDFWVVAFHNEKDETLHRQDADINEINRMMNDPDKYCKIWREFNTTEKPKYWVVWPHSLSKGWCERLTGNL